MTTTLAWPPPLLRLDQCDGEWERYVELLYGGFRRQFIETTPSLFGKQVWLPKAARIREKERTFWHLISESETLSDDELDRTINLHRCETILWAGAIIDRVPEGDIRVWRDTTRLGSARVHLCPDDFCHVVVLSEGQKAYFLVTAFPLEGNRKPQKYRARYETGEKLA